MMLEVVASAGIEPPMAEIPMKMDSRDAPMMMPVLKSPKINPANGATTIGRLRHCQDMM